MEGRYLNTTLKNIILKRAPVSCGAVESRQNIQEQEPKSSDAIRSRTFPGLEDREERTRLDAQERVLDAARMDARYLDANIHHDAAVLMEKDEEKREAVGIKPEVRAELEVLVRSFYSCWDVSPGEVRT